MRNSDVLMESLDTLRKRAANRANAAALGVDYDEEVLLLTPAEIVQLESALEEQ